MNAFSLLTSVQVRERRGRPLGLDTDTVKRTVKRLSSHLVTLERFNYPANSVRTPYVRVEPSETASQRPRHGGDSQRDVKGYYADVKGYYVDVKGYSNKTRSENENMCGDV